MPLTKQDARYAELLEAVSALHEGALDPLGRPRADHFDRVAQLLLARDPEASQAQIEAALVHDVIFHPGGGHSLLRKLAVDQPVIDILERIQPPPNAQYFTDIDNFTAADNAVYLEFIRTLVASGDREAIAVKLADITDTVSYLREIGSESALRQLDLQYEPSRKLLDAALTS
ncbi:MAG: HD domain-containing protein [Lautropia sp.]